jgi:cytochrome c biogenesis protein
MVEYGLLARGEDYRLAAGAAAIRSWLEKEWPVAQAVGDNDKDAKKPAGASAGPQKADKDQ